MEELSYYPGLIQRGSVFHYRKRVPTDIVGTFGRREIWTSLGTGNRPEAIKRARRVAVELDDKFDAHRNGQVEPFAVKELSQEAINRLAELRFQQVVVEHDKERLKTVQEVAAVADIPVRNENQSSDAPEEPVVTGDYAKDHASNLTYQKALRDHEESERQPKTAQSFLASMRLFIEVRGNKDISEYIKDDARKFQEVLIVYPANVWKFPELKDLTPKQIVARGMKPMSKNNAHKIFVFVGSFFRYALKSYDTMKANPFDGQGIKKEDNSDSRVPYTIDELNILFSSPLYHKVKSKVYCHRLGNVSMRDTGKFWLPLISLFTGMRMNEIAQIHREDIRHESGFLIFDLCKGDGKEFKTKASLRHIPVHHELLKCGLLQVRDSGKSERLFPEMKRGKDGTYSYTYSKWYGRFLNGIGIKRADLVFHFYLPHTLLPAAASLDSVSEGMPISVC